MEVDKDPDIEIVSTRLSSPSGKTSPDGNTTVAAKDSLTQDKNRAKLLSYHTCIIWLAIKNSPECRLTLHEIYTFIAKHFIFFHLKQILWKTTFHRILTRRKFFKMVQILTEQPNGNITQDYSLSSSSGCLWTVMQEKIPILEDYVKQFIKSPSCYKTALVYPEDLKLICKGRACDIIRADNECDIVLDPEESMSFPITPPERDLEDLIVITNNDIVVTTLEPNDKQVGVTLYSKHLPLPQDFYSETYSIIHCETID